MKNILLLMALLVITFSTLKAQTLGEEDMNDLEALEQSVNTKTPPINKVSRAHTSPTIEEEILNLGRDEGTGLLLGGYNLNNDSSRIGLAYQFSSDIKDLTDLSTFEVEYSHRFELAWVDFIAARTSGNFKELAQYKAVAVGSNPTAVNEETSDVLFLGTGLSTRTRYFADTFNLSGWFETIGAQVGYAQLSESASGTDFSGPALRASVSFYKRMSRSFHFGVKMSYNLASTKREANFDGESALSRHMTLQWTSFGLELGYYF